MAGDTRMTVYLQPKVYRALKVKSACTDRSVSELVSAAVLEALREDAVDVEAFDRRRKEPTHPVDQTAIPFSFTAYAFGCRASRRPIKTR